MSDAHAGDVGDRVQRTRTKDSRLDAERSRAHSRLLRVDVRDGERQSAR
jgi:hypothetical protein